jgi:hypothetical protein
MRGVRHFNAVDYGFDLACKHMTEEFLEVADQEGITEVGDWQSLDVSAMPQGKTVEMRNVVLEYEIPAYQMDVANRKALQKDLSANQPFAELQFQDRVSGKPLNPPPSFDYWPWRARGEEHQKCRDCGLSYKEHQRGGSQNEVCTFTPEKFSHTYPERFWPKKANAESRAGAANTKPAGAAKLELLHTNWGVRYAYGDLQDVVNQLARSPHTRQAYLPVWFPEDTGAVHGERVPCTLGVPLSAARRPTPHQLLHSDLVTSLRHFRDDVYMACRLCQWMIEEQRRQSHGPARARPRVDWDGIKPGTLTMHIVSFHVFEGDLPRLRKDLRASSNS